jgi:hypothetical protein
MVSATEYWKIEKGIKHSPTNTVIPAQAGVAAMCGRPVSRWLGGRLNLDFRCAEMKQNGRLDPAFGERFKLGLGVYI